MRHCTMNKAYASRKLQNKFAPEGSMCWKVKNCLLPSLIYKGNETTS